MVDVPVTFSSFDLLDLVSEVKLWNDATNGLLLELVCRFSVLSMLLLTFLFLLFLLRVVYVKEFVRLVQTFFFDVVSENVALVDF